MKRFIGIIIVGLLLIGCGGSMSNPIGPSTDVPAPQLGASETFSIEVSKAGAIYNGDDLDGYPNFTFFGTLTNTNDSSSIEVDAWATLQGCADTGAHMEYGRQTYILAPNESIVFSASGTFHDCDNMKPATRYKAAIHVGEVGSSRIAAFRVFYYSY